jgi:hypothetical protein
LQKVCKVRETVAAITVYDFNIEKMIEFRGLSGKFLKIALVLMVAFNHEIGICFGQDGDHDQYGGYKKIKSNPAGYFRIENKGDKWYLVTPDGNGFRAMGINHFSSKMENPQEVT